MLLLATSIAMSIWAMVETLRFEFSVAAQSYLHLPEGVGVSGPCEHFIPFIRRRNPVLSHLADLMSLLFPSSESTMAYDNYNVSRVLYPALDVVLTGIRTSLALLLEPLPARLSYVYQVLYHLARTKKQVYAERIHRVRFARVQ